MKSNLLKWVGLSAVLSASSVAGAYPIAVFSEVNPVYVGEFGGIDLDARASIETEPELEKYIDGFYWDLNLDGEWDLSSSSPEDNPIFGLEYAHAGYLEGMGLAGAGRHEFRLMAVNNMGEESDIVVGWFTVLEREVPPPVDVAEPSSLALFGLGIALLAMQGRRRTRRV